MSQTIRRNGSSARKVVAQQATARKVRSARARTGSVFDAIMGWLPFDEDQLHRIFLVLIFVMAAAIAVTIARVAGVPEMIAQQFSAAAANAGFAVEKVEVRGVKHLNELKVYERVQGDIGRPMPELDVERIRAELMQLSWVEDARVSRQLPDRLVIDIVERTPHAVLRKPDRLVLIDAVGNELEPIAPEAVQGKLVVSGPGAGKQVAALSTLLDAAPALKPQVSEAEWVGNRRWNLMFNTGQVLALPEGTKESAAALMAFARLDGVNRLIGGKVTAFDMRAPDRIYFRVPDRTTDQTQTGLGALAAASEAAAPDPGLNHLQAAAVAPAPAIQPEKPVVVVKPEAKPAKVATSAKAPAKADAKPKAAKPVTPAKADAKASKSATATKPAAKTAAKAPDKTQAKPAAKSAPKPTDKPAAKSAKSSTPAKPSAKSAKPATPSKPDAKPAKKKERD